MKKIDYNFELSKIQNKNSTNNVSRIDNLCVPLLIVACSFLAMVGVTFSAKIIEEEKVLYDIKIDIINGSEEIYKKSVSEGAFSQVINGKGSFGSLTCTSGHLEYDIATSSVYSAYINQDTSCIISFMDEDIESLEFDKLNVINDNYGKSYYFKADATNNYVKLKNDLYRIVRINGDGSIRLMADDFVLSALYGDFNNYEDSGVKTVLENWYKEKFSNEKYLVERDFDIANYYNRDYDLYNLIDLDGYYVSFVGTLSVKEAEIISKGVTGNNYLNVVNGFYLANPNGAYETYFYKDGKVSSIGCNNVLSVRPVINIDNVKLVGTGTKANPYVIEEE